MHISLTLVLPVICWSHLKYCIQLWVSQYKEGVKLLVSAGGQLR